MRWNGQRCPSLFSILAARRAADSMSSSWTVPLTLDAPSASIVTPADVALTPAWGWFGGGGFGGGGHGGGGGGYGGGGSGGGGSGGGVTNPSPRRRRTRRPR